MSEQSELEKAFRAVNNIKGPIEPFSTRSALFNEWAACYAAILEFARGHKTRLEFGPDILEYVSISDLESFGKEGER